MAEVSAHCAGHETRNEAPADGSGPSRVSAVSKHVATNTVGANVRSKAAAAGTADVVLWTPAGQILPMRDVQI